MNQAAFWVTPSARCNSSELIPFLQLAIIQTAGSHLVSDTGESSSTVPTLIENRRRGLSEPHVQWR